jgi:hypothetical protein
MARRYIESTASLSDCGTYRYDLRRRWDIEKPACLFVMLNPSTANATADDPTIRRCVGFAAGWGYGELIVVNLFALRATDPGELRKHRSPIGPANDAAIAAQARRAVLLVAGWGVQGALHDRGVAVRRKFAEWDIPLHHLGLTREGHPRHPLRLRRGLEPVPWEDRYPGDPDHLQGAAGQFLDRNKVLGSIS